MPDGFLASTPRRPFSLLPVHLVGSTFNHLDLEGKVVHQATWAIILRRPLLVLTLRPPVPSHFIWVRQTTQTVSQHVATRAAIPTPCNILRTCCWRELLGLARINIFCVRVNLAKQFEINDFHFLSIVFFCFEMFFFSFSFTFFIFNGLCLFPSFSFRSLPCSLNFVCCSCVFLIRFSICPFFKLQFAWSVPFDVIIFALLSHFYVPENFFCVH